MPAPYKNPGEAISLYNRVESIPGFFNYDDAQHFWLLLKMQEAIGIEGDLLEIGTWKGRSSAFMSYFVKGDQRIFLVDVFSAPAKDKYPEYPSIDEVRGNLFKVNSSVLPNSLVFISGNSSQLQLPKDLRLRFCHVDGGHSFDECYTDLTKITPHIISNGIVVIDDYDHPSWTEVKPAVHRWLEDQDGNFNILGEMNRNPAKGKKLYAIKA